MRLYKFLSTLRHNIMLSIFGYSPTCQQKPSCSQYTLEQMKKDGTIIGLAKGMWRVLHCRHV